MTETTEPKEEQLPKYEFVIPPKYPYIQAESYLNRLNVLAEQGYRVHTISYNFALMSLRQPTKYEGLTHMARAETEEEAQELLDNGWTVLTEYAAFIRMGKRT